MSLTKEEYRVLQMLIEEGWKTPPNSDAVQFIKPRNFRPIPGGSAVLIQLRQSGFLDNKNQITEAGRRAFKGHKLPTHNLRTTRPLTFPGFWNNLPTCHVSEKADDFLSCLQWSWACDPLPNCNTGCYSHGNTSCR